MYTDWLHQEIHKLCFRGYISTSRRLIAWWRWWSATLNLTYAVVLSFVPDILDGGGAEAVLKNIYKKTLVLLNLLQDRHMISVGSLLQFLHREGTSNVYSSRNSIVGNMNM